MHVIMECVTSCALSRQKCHYVYHSILLWLSLTLLVCAWWCTHSERKIEGVEVQGKKKAKKKKFSSTSFIFGVAAATGSKCYFICWNCELLFMSFGALFMKKYKIHKTQFLYRRRFFFYYILHKSGIIKQMNQFLMTFPFHPPLFSFFITSALNCTILFKRRTLQRAILREPSEHERSKK